ncbi:DUF6452 family protein [Bacteroides sp. 51]|uniref:DUF6452 family protein n=1 Tax=Bacteroides sp. 51 TaxID=2302938 RepID=UPI0013D54591|nr:DUF6452 family protein [Bacteroides sp. 51]NDV80938.1 calcium-binding protein P [Bacteroides sp. 51]
MKKFAKLIFILIVAYPLIGITVSSCAGESDCSTAGRAMLNGYIYRKTEAGTSVRDTLDSLKITAFGTDSILLNNQKDVHDLSLPLQYTKDTTIVIFQYSQVTTDTITIRHTNTPNFISMECGYEMKQAILGLKYTKHRLDSIRVTNNSTNTDGTKNLELYYR